MEKKMFNMAALLELEERARKEGCVEISNDVYLWTGEAANEESERMYDYIVVDKEGNKQGYGCMAYDSHSKFTFEQCAPYCDPDILYVEADGELEPYDRDDMINLFQLNHEWKEDDDDEEDDDGEDCE